MYICCMKNAKYKFEFSDGFEIKANSLKKMADLFFENFDKTHQNVYYDFVWDGKKYVRMNSDTWELYVKYYHNRMKLFMIEQDFK